MLPSSRYAPQATRVPSGALIGTDHVHPKFVAIADATHRWLSFAFSEVCLYPVSLIADLTPQGGACPELRFDLASVRIRCGVRTVRVRRRVRQILSLTRATGWLRGWDLNPRSHAYRL
jgi:hypothetical protein